LDQTRHIAKTQDYEYVDSEMIKLLSKVYAFYEKKNTCNHGFFFVPFHIKENIIRHVELQNVACTLMDQPKE
jgi:hypothetical protein